MRRSRAGLIENVLATIEAWHKDRVNECAVGNNNASTLNDTMANLLGRIDWDLVPVEAIKRAVKILLESAPPSEAQGVSEEAGRERDTLVCVVTDRLRERALRPDRAEVLN